MKKIIAIIIIILLVIFGINYFITGMTPPSVVVTPVGTTTAQVTTPQTLKYTSPDFEISYSKDFRVDVLTAENNAWYGSATSTGKILAKFTLSKTIEPSTNFSEASLVIATSSARVCKEKPQGGSSVTSSKGSINGVSFDKYTYSDAGAGNRYDTTSYRTIRNGNCYAVEYTVHSTNIGNYSPDQGISEFNASKINNLLEDVAQSFKFLK